MTILADTSIWIDYLRAGRSGHAAALDDLLESREVVICGPIAAELLAGTISRQRGELWSLLNGLDWFDLGRSQWRRTGEVAAVLRERGATVPLADVGIAVTAVEANASLWTRDKDFDRLSQVLPELKRFRPTR